MDMLLETSNQECEGDDGFIDSADLREMLSMDDLLILVTSLAEIAVEALEVGADVSYQLV